MNSISSDKQLVEVIEEIAQSIGVVAFENDVFKEIDDPWHGVDFLTHAKTLSVVYNHDHEEIEKYLRKAAKREYLKRISQMIEHLESSNA